METPRSLDLDGLDGIIPSPDKLQSKSSWLKVVAAMLFIILAVSILFFMQKQQPLRMTSAKAPVQLTETSPVEPSKPLTAEPSAEADQQTPSANDLAMMPTQPEFQENASPEQSRPEPRAQAAVVQNESILPHIPTEPTAAGNATNNAASDAPFTVYFKYDSSKPILSEAETSQLIDLARTCPKRILITGHTCNLGSTAGNLRLGQARANAVKKMLIANGIAARKIEAGSEGSSKPVASNDAPDGKAANRRAVLSCLDQ